MYTVHCNNHMIISTLLTVKLYTVLTYLGPVGQVERQVKTSGQEVSILQVFLHLLELGEGKRSVYPACRSSSTS